MPISKQRMRVVGVAALALALMLVAAAGLFYVANIPATQPLVPGRPPYRAPQASNPLGPLRVLGSNPRYFTADGSNAVLLTGSHTWANLVDSGFTDPPRSFDYPAYLEFLVHNQHNFFRLWSWEQARWAPWLLSSEYYFEPSPYRRTGPGAALDGKPKFDLDAFEPRYFERLRQRVSLAADRGIYVSVMLFNGWSIDAGHAGLGNGWLGHPFNGSNNVNGVDGDLDGDGDGDETHRLSAPSILAHQEAYVAKVVDTVNDLDNVLYEISNESYPDSRDWQYHLVRFVQDYERSKPKQHPVGMTTYVGLHRPTNGELFDSSADWVSPNRGPADEYAIDPPDSTGNKVVVLDTDHVWGIGGTREWAWKAFLRGYHLLFMDGYDGQAVGCGAPGGWDIRRASWKEIVKKVLGMYEPDPAWEPNAKTWADLRATLGDIQGFARRLPLCDLEPRDGLSSTGYILAGGREGAMHYLAYLPAGSRNVELDLSDCNGELSVEWFEPETGGLAKGGAVSGGTSRRLESPFAGDAVVYVSAERCGQREHD